MRRRDFVTLFGAAAGPHAARAQQADRIRRIGVLSGLARDDLDARAQHAAFMQGSYNWVGSMAGTCISTPAGRQDVPPTRENMQQN